MKQKNYTNSSSRGFLSFGGFIILLLLVGVVFLAYSMLRMPYLDDVEGSPNDNNVYVQDRIMKFLNFGMTGGTSNFRLSEGEINTYLNKVLRLQQDGAFSDKINCDRVLIDFEQGTCRIYVLRQAFDKPFVIGYQIALEEMGDRYKLTRMDGNIGTAYHIPAIVMQPIAPIFDKLWAVLPKSHTDAIRGSRSIKFEENAVVFSSQ